MCVARKLREHTRIHARARTCTCLHVMYMKREIEERDKVEEVGGKREGATRGTEGMWEAAEGGR